VTAVAVWLGTLIAVAAPRAATAQDAWDYTPYRIRVWLAVRPSAEVGPVLRNEIIQTLVTLAPVYGGATWQLEAEEAPETIRSSVEAALDELTVEQIAAAREGALAPDKVMLLSVCEEASAFSIACRELDCRTRTLGSTVRTRSWQRARLARDAADAVADAFAPLVRVESSRGRKASVRMRASGLVRFDHCPSLVKTGDVLRPVIRRNDRRGEPKPGGIEVLEWTYLLVREPQDYLLDCDVYSASRNPLVGRNSANLERMALRVRPRGPSTELQLVARGQSPQPLEGYEIVAKKPVAEEAADPNASVRLGLTDWRGMIAVERTDLPLRLIYVKNGSHLIARLPVVPGFLPHQVMALPSDDKRLEAEAFVKGMESTVMDLVARREILSSRIRRRIQEGKFDQARQLLDEIKGFQTKEDLEMMLTSRQQAGLSSADAWQQQRIDQMLSGTRILLNKYLDPEQLVALQREVEAAAQTPPAAATKPSAADATDTPPPVTPPPGEQPPGEQPPGEPPPAEQ
jgi:hypothetical protein